MDDRLPGLAALLVGIALAVVGATEYVVTAPPPWDPFATGVFVVGTGVLAALAGGVALRTGRDAPSVRATALVGLATLALAVVRPAALTFGGVFWLAMVAVAFAALGAYLTVDAVD